MMMIPNDTVDDIIIILEMLVTLGHPQSILDSVRQEASISSVKPLKLQLLLLLIVLMM